jgi:Protein of unknown function (DUF2800)
MSITVKKKHALFSASSSERWLACPGSIELGKKAPPQSESKYAEEGTRAHECFEFFLKNGASKNNIKRLLKLKYSEEMITHARSAALWVFDRVMKAGAGARLYSETRSDLSFIEPGTFGTFDAMIVEPFGTLTVVDFKFGAGVPVSPDENPQLIFYSLGVAHAEDYNFKEVELVIIQPRAAIEGKTVRTSRISVERLLDWREIFAAGIGAAKQKNAPLNAGDHCRFCPAQVICPELSTRALKQAEIDFSDIETTAPAALPLVDSVSLDRLPAYLTAFPRIKKWMDAVEAYAFERLESGEKITGFTLVEKRGTRRWTDARLAEKLAREEFGDAAFSGALLSPAQLEKLGAEGREFAAKHSTSVSSGLTLAPLSGSNRRTSPENDFA